MKTSSTRLSVFFLCALVLSTSLLLAQDPKQISKEVIFGNATPAKGDSFLRKKKSDSTVNMTAAGKKTKTKNKESSTWKIDAIDSMDIGVFAASFELQKHKSEIVVVADGKTTKQSPVDSRLGKTVRVAYAERELMLREMGGNKGLNSSSPEMHLKFFKDLKRLLPLGIVFDAGDGRTTVLKGKSFVVGKTYKDLYALTPEMKAAMDAQKGNTKDLKSSSSTKFLRLSKVDGLDCVVLKTKSKLKLLYEQGNILMQMNLTSTETVTVAVETCWHIKTMSNATVKMTGKLTTGKKPTVLKLDSKVKITTSSSFVRGSAATSGEDQSAPK